MYWLRIYRLERYGWTSTSCSILWIGNSVDNNAAKPNYYLLHWLTLHINGPGFAQLNAYEICRLVVIILRTVPHNEIRYILGTTGESCTELWLHCVFPSSDINYVFIRNEEQVRAWLLLNPVLEDPLDQVLYPYRRYTAQRVATLLLRRLNYLAESARAHWVPQARACIRIHAPRIEVRPVPNPANAGGNKTSLAPLFVQVSSCESFDVTKGGEGCSAIIGTSPSPVLGPTESDRPHVLLTPITIQNVCSPWLGPVGLLGWNFGYQDSVE